MPTVSSTFTDLYAPGLRKVIFENYTYRPTEYESFLNVGSSRRQFEDDYRMAGFGAVPPKPEGTAIIYDDPVPDTTVRWVWTPYGKGFRSTHEAMVDDLYGPMRKMAASLGRAFRNETEVIGASVLVNAFTDPAAGATNSGYDDLALCSGDTVSGTPHTLARGGTARNEPSVAVDLGVTALQNAIIDFERFVDESNRTIVFIPRMLIVAPENVPLAGELLGSQFKPFTADNEINVIQQAGLQMVVSHYITSTNDWFISADKSETDLWLIWREKFITDAGDDFDTGDGKIKGYMRLGAGFGDWRGFWGSPGV